MNVRWRHLISAVLSLLCGLAAGGALTPGLANGQTIEEFEKLNAQCWELIHAGRYADAEPLAERLHRWAKGPLANNSRALSSACNTLGVIYWCQARYAEAEPLYKRALEIRRKLLGDEHPDVATSLDNLAVFYRAQARYAEAEPLCKRALEVFRKAHGDEHPDVATSRNNLAVLYHAQSRYAEAEPLLKRALEIRRKLLGDEHPDVAAILNNLALLYNDQARYAEAEPLYKLALKILRKAFGDEHPNVAGSLNNLAVSYNAQGRYAEAEPLRKRALEIRRKLLGDEHPDVAGSLNDLAIVYHYQGRHAEAESLHKRALEIKRKALGAEHPVVALSLSNLAGLYDDQARYAEAESLYKRALEIRRNLLGDEHPEVAGSLNNLAVLYHAQDRYAEAEPLLREALAIVERGTCDPQLVAWVHWNRAELAWATERPDEAVVALKQAWKTIEWLRTQVAGGDQERARYFASWTNQFERMVSWQHQLGTAAELGDALEAMERSRARMLLDQINAAGQDLLAGVPADEAERLRRRESEAAANESTLRRQLELLPGRKDLSDTERSAKEEQLLAELRDARGEYADAHAAIRSVSPLYRLAVGADLQPVSLDRLAQYVNPQQALLLEYLLGDEGGYVLVLPAGGPPRLAALTVEPAQAERLGVEPGPLTAKRMSKILRREDGTGVLQRMLHPDTAREATGQLAALWEVLVPESERQAILDERYRRLIVLPDAALAQLPFETLVVSATQPVWYLLEAGPPILYAPSASLLVNLAARKDEAKKPAEQPVLSIGDCVYGAPAKADDGELLAALSPRNRYSGVGGQLSPLEYAGAEIDSVGRSFRDQKIRVAALRGKSAREQPVRQYGPGRRVLHFATHGVVDEAYGNLFGALALTPGSKPDNAADDGLLTLAEVVELDLAGCRLTILSACDTNAGPEQRGEGVVSLARGFLVAGSQRVVATQWLVADEATARLVGRFCELAAAAESADGEADYAKSLCEARRWLRRQPGYESPFFWAPFVLIGPP